MRRNTRGFLVVFVLAFVGILAFTLLFLAELLKERSGGHERSEEIEIPHVGPPDVVEPPSIVEAEPVPIVGRVLDRSLAPISGMTCVLRAAGSEEIAATDDGGRFSFPPRDEPGEMEFALRQGEEDVARWTVFAGSGGGARVLDDGSAMAKPTVVERPWRALWSVVLFLPSGENPATRGSSAVDAVMPFSSVFSLSSILIESAPPETVPPERFGSSGAVHYAGTTRLPDGAFVSASIYYVDKTLGLDERLVAGTTPAEVEGGSFRGSFDLPEDFDLYSAHYDFRVGHDKLYADFEQVEKWKREITNLPWDELDDGESVWQIYVGFEEEELEDNRKLSEYYGTTLNAAVGLHKLRRKQFDETIKLGGGWDPALLTEREESRASWVESGAVAIDGSFRESEWRRFVDDELRPRVAQLLEEVEKRPETKFGKAALDLEAFLRNLGALSRMESKMIYEHFGLHHHKNDHYIDDLGVQSDASLLNEIMDHTIEKLTPYTAIPPSRRRDPKDRG